MSSDKPSDPSKEDLKSQSLELDSKSGWQKVFADNLPTVIVAVLMAAGVRVFIVEPRYIPSSSMEPTLQIDDRLLIDKLTFKWRKPERGEIIVFNPPPYPGVDTSKVYIKRVIGLPGDRISIHDGKVYVNGNAISEPYIASPPAYSLPTDPTQCPECFQPSQISLVNKQVSFTVPPSKYWMMGDNRNNSQDSHIWGFLPEENIVGRAFYRYWPFDSRTGGLSTPTYEPSATK
ncbi:signal peptidase I [Tumidithrix elongata RA019]|uniref:Signal peptidase I n=1 Tax=Tumidithrix elongata BACA0141 TaxID=2716417 RepID=A0AAW9Q900_9CYAN|nr:signal peptidase I [Tumidithrix elongata RA019]